MSTIKSTVRDAVLDAQTFHGTGTEQIDPIVTAVEEYIEQRLARPETLHSIFAVTPPIIGEAEATKVLEVICHILLDRSPR